MTGTPEVPSSPTPLLEWERSFRSSGHINLERLMTRLDSLMPCDYAENAGNAANEHPLHLRHL